MAGEIQLNSVSFASESSGTITVNNGTIGNSVVFPSGHVIQTVRSTKSGSSSTTTSTTFAKVQNSSSETFGATINNVAANSKILIQTNFVSNFSKSSNNAGGQYGLYRESTIILGESTLSNPGSYYQHTGVTDTLYYVPQFIMFLDESPGTGTNNYFLGYAAHSGTSVGVLGHIPTFEMILMEIAE